MEDTACQAECPVNPKACIVINTAKPVVSRPAPTRDGSSYQTNVPGCYIIGDVSGVPLIKNAVKEGYEVIAHISGDLKNSPPEPKAEYDVAIVGIGPAGASAAAAAQEDHLRYVAIEQDKVLSTIEAYPKGKYIFFKPDTKDWFGGLPAAGLGLTKSKYAASAKNVDDEAVWRSLGSTVNDLISEQGSILMGELVSKIPTALRPQLSPLLAEKIEAELRTRIAAHLRSKGSLDVVNTYRTDLLPRKDEVMAGFRRDIIDQIVGRVPGDQRENILDVWMNSLHEKGVKINEFESCKAITRADDGDYFRIETERREGDTRQTYSVRRVVIAIGLRGAPNRLRLPNEDMKVTIAGREQPKVLYSLTNPADFRGRRIVVVGGGNVAVEAAVDLVAQRIGSAIEPRPAEQMNQVTMLVRTSFAPTVKFGNKFQLYQCADGGILDLRFGVAIKEMREHELVLEDVRTGEEIETIANDYVFALIGGERPDRFLQSVGITLT
jgi:thioredoxin reductase